jgi:hypothetical protein
LSKNLPSEFFAILLYKRLGLDVETDVAAIQIIMKPEECISRAASYLSGSGTKNVAVPRKMLPGSATLVDTAVFILDKILFLGNPSGIILIVFNGLCGRY